LFAASMVAVCSAASGGLRGSKQDAMKEVSGPAKHYTGGLKPFPGNIGLYDETPSGEQGAMEEVSGTSKGLLGRVEHFRCKGSKSACHAAKKIAGPGGMYHPPKKTDKVILHDEDRSGEQDAMKEVSGTSKGLLGTVEHLGDKGAKVAYHAAKKIEKKILHDEDRSGEQDAMEEVSGTSKGLLGTVEHLGDKGAKVAYHAAKKIEKKILHDEDRSGEQDAMEEVSGTAKPFLRKP